MKWIGYVGLALGLSGCLAVFAQMVFASIPGAERWPIHLLNTGCVLLVLSKVVEWINARSQPLRLKLLLGLFSIAPLVLGVSAFFALERSFGIELVNRGIALFLIACLIGLGVAICLLVFRRHSTVKYQKASVHDQERRKQ